VAEGDEPTLRLKALRGGAAEAVLAPRSAKDEGRPALTDAEASALLGEPGHPPSGISEILPRRSPTLIGVAPEPEATRVALAPPRMPTFPDSLVNLVVEDETPSEIVVASAPVPEAAPREPSVHEPLPTLSAADAAVMVVLPARERALSVGDVPGATGWFSAVVEEPLLAADTTLEALPPPALSRPRSVGIVLVTFTVFVAAVTAAVALAGRVDIAWPKDDSGMLHQTRRGHSSDVRRDVRGVPVESLPRDRSRSHGSTWKRR
jgi:hypothetical protein